MILTLIGFNHDINKELRKESFIKTQNLEAIDPM